MVEYGPVPDERVPEFRAVLQYAFEPAAGPPDVDPDDPVPPRRSLGERRGLFDGGDLVSVAKHLRFALRLRGDHRDAVGVSLVATPPAHRGRGHLRRLLAESLAEFRSRDRHVAVLWPFDHRFYRRLGWGDAGRFVTYECPPEALAVGEAAAAGRFRRVGPDDFRVLDAVYREHAAPYALHVDRTEKWYRKRVFRWEEGDPHVFAWERDGDPRGYLVYAVLPGDDGPDLRVGDLAYADHEALVNLLGFCSHHDSQVATVTVPAPTDVALFDVLDDPAAPEVTVRPGPMARLVDVRALAALQYPPDAAGTVVLEVADDLAAWNDGRFALEVAGGGASVTPTDRSPDVGLDVATLSAVVVGHRSVADARATGDLTADDDGAAALLGDWFPETTPYLRDYF